MKKLLILSAAAAVLALPASADCRYEQTVNPRIFDSSGLKRVSIDASAGSLEVIGNSGSSVEARGTACSDDEDFVDEIRLDARQSGETLYLVVDIPERRSWFRGHSHARLDLKVELPSSLAVSIDDGSGSIVVRNVGDLDIDDGSGEIDVRTARSVKIDDGSGDIEVTDVAGLVEIDDGSGSIDISDVRGSVNIIDDGSGEIDIVQVTGDVEIGDDGSGSIYVSDVGGNLLVGDHGSGGISFDRINGQIRVKDW